MPDTYSIKPQIYNISHANTNVDFVTKKRYFLWHTTYTPQFHSPQICTRLGAAGFRWSPAASFVLCLLIRRATSQHNIQALLDVLPSTCTVFVEVIFEGVAEYRITSPWLACNEKFAAFKFLIGSVCINWFQKLIHCNVDFLQRNTFYCRNQWDVGIN